MAGGFQKTQGDGCVSRIGENQALNLRDGWRELHPWLSFQQHFGSWTIGGRIKSIPGVVENGLFVAMCDQMIMGKGDQVILKERRWIFHQWSRPSICPVLEMCPVKLSVSTKPSNMDSSWCDGRNFPNITFGAVAMESFSKPEGCVFDTHLMVVNPEKHIPAFSKAGADVISIHAEATEHLQYGLKMIRDHGAKAGVALNPATPLEALDWVYLTLIWCFWCRSIRWGGQSFIAPVFDKISSLRQRLQDRGINTIQIDGESPENHCPCFLCGHLILLQEVPFLLWKQWCIGRKRSFGNLQKEYKWAHRRGH